MTRKTKNNGQNFTLYRIPSVALNPNIHGHYYIWEMAFVIGQNLLRIIIVSMPALAQVYLALDG